jgi:hypothetical protein
MDIRGSRCRKKAEGDWSQKQAQNDPTRINAASGGPNLSSCSHLRPAGKPSHADLGILEAKTIRDYTYDVWREGWPFAALFWLTEVVTTLTFPLGKLQLDWRLLHKPAELMVPQ